jgi:hypothetical protein
MTTRQRNQASNPINEDKRRKRYTFHWEEQPMVVHRSANRVILAGDAEIFKGKKNLDRGWRSPEGVPYRPIGEV